MIISTPVCYTNTTISYIIHVFFKPIALKSFLTATLHSFNFMRVCVRGFFGMIPLLFRKREYVKTTPLIEGK
jgi:hypothetical protein